MSTLYHFGDSYSLTFPNPNIKHFGKHIANTIGFEYHPAGVSGNSNEQILNIIIKYLTHFQSGDIVFVNFSFISRGSWYNNKKNQVESTNRFNDRAFWEKRFSKSEDENNKVISLINYYLEYTEDYVSRVFTLINSTLSYIESSGISIFYIFIDDAPYLEGLIKVGTNIKFKNGFHIWLRDNGFHGEEEGHYTFGIQQMLSNVILKKTNNLNINTGKSVDISIDDVDLNLIIEKDKLSFLI